VTFTHSRALMTVGSYAIRCCSSIEYQICVLDVYSDGTVGDL